MVFPGWTAWHWVALAWGQLLGAYVAYLAYMQWRVQNLKKDLNLNDVRLSDNNLSNQVGSHLSGTLNNHDKDNPKHDTHDKDNHG